MNINKLKGKIAENGMNVSQLAMLMGVGRDVLYKKFKPDNAERLTIGEAARIAKILHLTGEEASDIFLT